MCKSLALPGGKAVRWEFGHEADGLGRLHRPAEPWVSAGGPACAWRGRRANQDVGDVPGEDEIGLQKEGVRRVLEGGDGTVGMGEGGVKMGDDVGGGAVLSGQRWRRTESRQSGAEVALGEVEA